MQIRNPGSKWWRLCSCTFCTAPIPPTCDNKDLLILGHPITSPPSLPPPPPQPHRMSAKIGAGCCNHIAFSALNLNLNSKSNKIWKNQKEMAFLRNILFCLSDISLQSYDTSKFEKNAFFTKSAAVHNFYNENSPWNLDLNSKSHKIWKNMKGMAFLRNIYFVCRTFRCKYMTPQIGGRFWKKYFFTQLAVVHCDPSSSRVWLMVGGGGRTSICGMAKD